MSVSCEIGSEFWEVPTSDDVNEVFPSNTKWFLSGRSALTAILIDVMSRFDIHTVALPSWCCESIILPMLKKGLDVRFYPVTYDEGYLNQDLSAVLNCDLILVNGYFGFLSSPNRPVNFKGIVVEDVTQSLLSRGWCNQADYRFGSLRKWCGLWTGGFAWRCDGRMLSVNPLPSSREYVCLRKRAMEKKASYMHMGTGYKECYLSLFSEAEKLLDRNFTPMEAATRDLVCARKLDVDGMRMIRRSNAKTLLDGLYGNKCISPVFEQLHDDDCPLFVPVVLKNRDKLRQYLIDHKVYCPVHWPITSVHRLDIKTTVLYERSLSLVCDQRYSRADMQRVLDLVSEWQKIN